MMINVDSHVNGNDSMTQIQWVMTVIKKTSSATIETRKWLQLSSNLNMSRSWALSHALSYSP